MSKFLNFKLVDEKSMTKQVHEFETLVHALKALADQEFYQEGGFANTKKNTEGEP